MKLTAPILEALDKSPRWGETISRWGGVLSAVEAAMEGLDAEARASLLVAVEAGARGWVDRARSLPVGWDSLERVVRSAAVLPLCRTLALGEESAALKDLDLLAALLGHAELAHITRIELDQVALNAAQIGVLAAHKPAKVTTLVIRACALKAAGVRMLCDAPALLAGLEVLSLPKNKLNAEAAEVLAQCPHLGGLRELDLSENPLGEVGRVALGRSPYLSYTAKVSAKAIATAQGELAPTTEDAREVFGDLRSVLQQAPSAHGWARICDLVSRIDAERATHETLPYAVASLSAWEAAQRPLMAAWKDQIMLGEEVPPAAQLARAMTLDGVGLNAKVAGRLGAFAAQAGIERVELRSGNPSSKALRGLLEAPGFTTLRELVYDYVLDDASCAVLCEAGRHRLERLEIGELGALDAASSRAQLFGAEMNAGLKAFGIKRGVQQGDRAVVLREASWWWGLRELELWGELSYGRGADAPLAALLGGAADPVWSQLRALKLAQPIGGGVRLDLDALTTRLPALRSLDVGMYIGPEVMWGWMPALCGQLESLRLREISIHDTAPLEGIELWEGDALRVADLGFSHIGTPGSVATNEVSVRLMRAPCWRGLTSLRLGHMGLSDAQLGELIEALPDGLQELALTHSNMDVGAARAMAGRAWPALRALSLNFLGLSAEVLEILSRASWWGQIEALSLDGYYVERGPEGRWLPAELKALAVRGLYEVPLLHLLKSGLPGTLESISLCGVLATKTMPLLVAALPELPRLHTLDLGGNSVTAKSLEGLLASPRLGQIPLILMGSNRLGLAGKQRVLGCAEAPIALKSSI